MGDNWWDNLVVVGIVLSAILWVFRWSLFVILLFLTLVVGVAFISTITCHHIYIQHGYVKLASGQYTPNYREVCE